MRRYLGIMLLGLALAGTAFAQTAWPDRPVRFIVGSTPGGSNDFVGRLLADALARHLGQPFVVDNRPGAGSSLGADFAAKSAPDGYTVLVGANATMSVNPAIDPKWLSVQNMVPVVKVSVSPLVIAVNAQLGIKTVPELVAYARKNPGKLNFAHSGTGTAPHLGGVLFRKLTGVNIVDVPFKGGGPALQSVLAGDTQVTFATPPTVLPHLKSGRIVAIGVTQPERFSLAPDLPAMKEAGLNDYKLDLWYGLFVPAGTPADIVRKLHDATVAVLKRPEVKAQMESGGMEVSLLASPAEFANFVRDENRYWSQFIKDAGIKPE